MRRIWEKEWFGIEFKSFVKLDSKKIADVSFYNRFYNEFYRRFSSYEELPQDWRKQKSSVADLIYKITKDGERLLSIGCGIGYIEYLLRKRGREVVVVEPSRMATKFLKKFANIKIYHGYFPQCLSNTNENNNFDLAYMVAVDYVFNKKELLNFLQDVKRFGIKNFLLVSVSIHDRRSLKQSIKYLGKLFLGYLKIYELGMFWGYSRAPEEFYKAFNSAGFRTIKQGFLDKKVFWIMGVSGE